MCQKITSADLPKITTRTQHKLVYLVEDSRELLQLHPVEDKHVVNSCHGEHGDALLLPQHAARRAGQAARKPRPTLTPCPLGPLVTVSHVAEQRQEKKQRSANVGPAHDACNGFSVDRV